MREEVRGLIRACWLKATSALRELPKLQAESEPTGEMVQAFSRIEATTRPRSDSECAGLLLIVRIDLRA